MHDCLGACPLVWSKDVDVVTPVHLQHLPARTMWRSQSQTNFNTLADGSMMLGVKKKPTIDRLKRIATRTASSGSNLHTVL